MTLTDVTLTGVAGGSGGSGTNSAGGLGGLGGGSVFGGVSFGGTGGTGDGDASGGAGGTANDNRVSLTNVTLSGAAGGTGGTGVSGNAAADGMPGGDVFGGFSFGGTGGTTYNGDANGGAGGAASGNSVTITGTSSISNAVDGGYSLGGVGGANMGTGNANGGDGGAASGNSVTITGSSSIGLDVHGGYSLGGAGGTSGTADANGGAGGTVSGNSVLIAGTASTSGDVYGGVSSGGTGGAAGSGNANGGAGGVAGGNSVTVTGASSITGGVFGGASTGGHGGQSDSGVSNGGAGGAASGNSVLIAGTASITGGVYGGVSFGGSAGNAGVGGVGGEAINNSVTLTGTHLTIGGSVVGGASINGDGSISAADAFTGNTLNLVGYRGSVGGVFNFQNFNWLLPSDVANGQTLITITGGTGTAMDNTVHTVSMEAGGYRFKAGDTVILISKTTGNLPSSNNSQHFNQGQFITYDATLAQTGTGDDALVLTIDSQVARLNPQSKAYSEGRAASLGFVRQGNDLIAGNIASIRAETGGAAVGSLTPFFIGGGASQRLDTGSHVTVDGFNMLTGVATGLDLDAKHHITIGAFFEYGTGSYNTYNSFTNFASVRGSGNTDYTGGGVFGRIDFAGTGLGRVSQLAPGQADGLYLDASLRVGRATNDFDIGSNADVLGISGGDYRGSYDSSSTYYGGHVGGGYVANIDAKQSLDVYGRYLWLSMQADTAMVGPEALHFGSAMSSVAQVGARYSYAYSDQFKPYVGFAYAYEFDGDIAARAYEFQLDRPSLKGGTGVFEAGFNVRPIAGNNALSIIVSGQAYVGEVEGGGGYARLKYSF